MSWVMHFVYPLPDGPLESGPGPALPAEIQPLLGQTHVGPGGRWAVACGLPVHGQPPKLRGKGDPGFLDGQIHRATAVSYAGVTCKGCLESEIFLALKEPHPNTVPALDKAVAELPGCC